MTIQQSFAPGAALPPPSFKAMDQNLRIPYSQHASLAVEHQFGAPILVSIGGTWLHNVGFFSQDEPGRAVANGTSGTPPKPWPQLGGSPTSAINQYGHYYALEGKVQTRQWHGQPSLPPSPGGRAWTTLLRGTPPSARPVMRELQDPHNIRGSFGRSSHDFERRFTQSWVYHLPTPFKSTYTSSSSSRFWGSFGRMGMVRRTDSTIRIPPHPSVAIRQQ